MFIEVLYADLSRQRVPIEQAGDLPNTGILAMILSCVDEEKPRVTIDGVGYRRRAQAHGKDFYYLLHYTDEGKDWYAIEARDRSEFAAFYAVQSPWSEFAFRKEHPRYGCFMLVFEGVNVSDEAWAEAVELFEKEVH